MASLAEIRKTHPEYEDLSDQQLADGLYAKFYSDMPRAQFDEKVGLLALANDEAGPVNSPGPVEPADAPEVAAPEPQTQIVETPTKVSMGPSASEEPRLPEGFADAYRQYIEQNKGKLTVEGLEGFVKNLTGSLPQNAQEVVDFQNTYHQVSPDARATRPPVIKPTDGTGAGMLKSAGLGAENVATFGLSPQINAILKMAGESEAAGLEGGVPAPTSSYQGALQQVRAEEGGYRQEYPGSYMGGQLAGALIPWGKTPTSVAGFARQGALQGGAYGAGSAIGEGQDLPGIALQGALGSGLGTLAGGALGGLGKVFPKKAMAPARVQEAAMAAERQGIDLPETLVKPKAAEAAKGLGDSRSIVTEAEDASRKSIGDKSATLALDYGTPAADAMDLGMRAQRSAASWIKGVRGDAQKLYDEGEKLTNDIVVPPVNLTQTLDAKREELLRLPKTNKALIDVINDIASDLTGAKLAPKDMRKLRTNLSNRLGASDLGLAPSDKSRLITELTQAASNDMKAALNAAASAKGGEGYAKGLAAFEKGDALWKQQSRTTKNTLSAILGKSADDILETSPDVWGAQMSPEQAARAIQQFTGKNHRRLVQLMGTLDPATQNTVKASLINSLGRDANGFDPAKFIKQLDAIPDRTQRALFGADGVSALNDLKSVSGLFADPVGKSAGKSSYFTNRLKYALYGAGALGGMGGMVAGGPIGGGLAAGAAAGTLLAGKKLLTDPIAAKLMADPRAAQKIAKLAKAGNPDQRQAVLQSLAAYANRTPQVRDAVGTFIERMANGPSPDEKPLVIGGKQDKPAADGEDPEPAGDADVRAALVGQEGSGKNPKSSATGTGQFIDSTFSQYAKKLMPEETQGLSDDQIASEFRGRAMGDGRPIEEHMLDASMADNRALLKSISAPVTPGNEYLAHFLGANDLPVVLKAPRDTALIDLLAPKVLSANSGIRFNHKPFGDWTVADLLGWSTDVMDRRIRK